jgi:hypothetical protein
MRNNTSIVDKTSPIIDQMAAAAMTVPEFCKWARIGRTAVYREIKSGRLVLRKCGAKSLILVSDAQRWINALPASAA